MQPLSFAKLSAGTSSVRLEVYRSAGDTDFTVFCNYLWNAYLCEALYPALQTLEVVLRNSIHEAASTEYKTPNWFDGSWPLHQSEADKIAYARSELTKQQKAHDPGRIIAELTFGFWSSLFDSRYDRVWPRIILPAFPSMPRTIRHRRTLSKRLNSIRRLRNRVFHHERITHFPDLSVQHAEIIEAIGWISTEWWRAIRAVDRFPDIHSGGVRVVREKLQALFV
jgi:hypothetical protein